MESIQIFYTPHFSIPFWFPKMENYGFSHTALAKLSVMTITRIIKSVITILRLDSSNTAAYRNVQLKDKAKAN